MNHAPYFKEPVSSKNQTNICVPPNHFQYIQAVCMLAWTSLPAHEEERSDNPLLFLIRPSLRLITSFLPTHKPSSRARQVKECEGRKGGHRNLTTELKGITQAWLMRTFPFLTRLEAYLPRHICHCPRVPFLPPTQGSRYLWPWNSSLSRHKSPLRLEIVFLCLIFSFSIQLLLLKTWY